MKNNQLITKASYNDGDYINVNSIFYTIQGEGPFGGYPAIFIRLQGCNLRCHWCDTEYSEGETWGLTPLVDKVRDLWQESGEQAIIVLTGGEPMSQNISPLLEKLTQFTMVQIETNGTACPPNYPWINRSVFLVISPKTGKLHPEIQDHCNHVAAWKYILSAADGVDSEGLPTTSTQVMGKSLKIYRPHFSNKKKVFVSPLDNLYQSENMKFCADVAMKHGFRVSLQTHKILGVE